MNARKIRITDHRGRDAVVALEACRLKLQVSYQNAPGRAFWPTRVVKSSAAANYQALMRHFGNEPTVAKALIDGDPELDLEAAGQKTGPCRRVFVDGNGEPMYAARVVEIHYGPDGTERERREPMSYSSNLLDPRPWSGKILPRAAAARRFAFTRKYLVRHVDALTFDFLLELAEYLESRDSLVIIGSGANGAGPMILERNGAPMLGLLEGRTDGDGYLLILHLAAFEFRRPLEAAQ